MRYVIAYDISDNARRARVAKRLESVGERVQGSVTFLRTGAGVDHESFVTHAWAPDPIRDVLERMSGYARDPGKRTAGWREAAR